MNSDAKDELGEQRRRQQRRGRGQCDRERSRPRSRERSSSVARSGTAHVVEPVSASRLASELLERTDAESGDVCMFHYSAVYVPKIDADEMGRALELVLASSDDAASEEARSRVTRIQFSWYQFDKFPREVLGRTYPNLRHVDIRQNASLTCIDSLVSQLPLLTSLNLSDCPNVRTLAPLASALVATADDLTDDTDNDRPRPRPARRRSALRHLWVRGCDLSSMSRAEWGAVFDALAESSGPLERLTLSRNDMGYLHENVGKLRRLTYLFVEDNRVGVASGGVVDGVAGGHERGGGKGFGLPDELGDLSDLRFSSFCGNDVTSLPRTMGRLPNSCDVYLHRNPNLSYPPAEFRGSVGAMRDFFHRERMTLLRGVALFVPHLERARRRANERLYEPGGRGYERCRTRFEGEARRTSSSAMLECD